MVSNIKNICMVFCLMMVLPTYAETGKASAEEETHWLEDFTDDPELFDFDGYRIQQYRSPTPAHSQHAKTINSDQVVELLETLKPAVIDVQPLSWNNVFIQKEARKHIPGSVWLPNVGQGSLEGDWETYYRVHLQRVTQGNKAQPIIIYCTADCWMSWNAIKRAAEWGYSNLFWFRNGTDEWLQTDKLYQIGKPEPFPVN